MMSGDREMANGLGPGAPGMAPFGNNFRSIENVNETTITNLADEFLNADFTNRHKNDGSLAAPHDIHSKVEYYAGAQQMQTQERMNPFLS